MRFRTTAVVVLAAGALLTACGPDSTSSSGTSSSSLPSATATTASTAGSPATTEAAAEQTSPVQRFVGMGLQSAQDKAQAAGFYNLASHDSAGRDRMQILDRDWKVCSQNVAPGKSVPTDTKLDFGVVKLEETCPATEQKPPAKAGATMPNFTGKGLNTARAALDPSTSITATDALEDRMILLESNWQVCTQDPKAGAPLNGQPVAFTAVKFGESCP